MPGNIFPHSFEVSRDARGTARRDQAASGVEDFKLNFIGERGPVSTKLDGPRKPVCLDPGSGWAKDEGLGHSAVSVALCVTPDTQAGSA